MRNVAVLSHIADIDGVGAAALVKMRYRIPLSNIFFTGHDRDEVAERAQKIKRMSKDGFLLFITDLSPNADTAKIYEDLVTHVKRRGGSVVWLDHHIWKKQAIDRIARKCDVAIFGENSKICATQMVHRFLGLDSRFANEFADMIHYIDLFLPTSNRKYRERAEEYKLAFAYYLAGGSHSAQQNKLRRLAGVISAGKFTDASIDRDAMKFKKLHDERLRLLFNNLVYLSKNVVLGFSKQVDSTDAGHGMLQRSGADVAIVVKIQTGHCSIRSRKSNTVPLANAFGGGGHPHASGFSIDTKRYNSFKTISDRKMIVELIEKKARSVGLL